MESCFTYFCVRYNDNFNLEDFKKELGLVDKVIHVKNSRKIIEIGLCKKFNIDVNIMVRESLRVLFGKEKILLKFKEKYDLEYYLERVVYICKEDGVIHPILSLDFDIVEFLYKTNTIDDLDYYVC